jgi:hypothetical protein
LRVAKYRADVLLLSCALQSHGIDSQTTTPAAVMSVVVATPGVHCENLALRARVLLLSCRRRTTFFVHCVRRLRTGGTLRTSPETQENSLSPLTNTGEFTFVTFNRIRRRRKVTHQWNYHFWYPYVIYSYSVSNLLHTFPVRNSLRTCWRISFLITMKSM